MDELKDAIGRTNELLQELLARDRAKQEESEQRMREIQESVKVHLPKESEVATSEHKSFLDGVRSPDHEKMMAEVRERAGEVQRRQDEFNERVIEILNEQTEILRAIARTLPSG